MLLENEMIVRTHPNLGNFKLGVIVDNGYGLVGHVVGFEMNCTDEVVVRVQWCDGETYAIHPANINSWGE